MNQMKDYLIPKLAFLLLFFSLISCHTMKRPILDFDPLAELISLDYFEYADANVVEKITLNEIKSSLNSNLIFEVYDELSFEPLTKRNYIIDGEFLSDVGGIENFLITELRPFYNSSGLKLEIMNHKIEFDKATFERHEKITVNNTEYQIFSGESTERSEGWYIAPIRMTQLLNEELRIQGLKERFYLINSGNDLIGVFLTDLQFEFFRKYIKDKYWQPQTPEGWKDLYNIEIEL